MLPGLSSLGDPVKLMIHLAASCAVALMSSTAMARAAAREPEPPPQPKTAAAAEPRPASIAALSALERALRTSLAPTAIVVSHSDNALELWYPVRLAFAPDGTELLSAATTMLDLLARSLREYEHTSVVVAVYTDAIGSAEYNQQQSLSRAAAVVAYLESKGVAAARLVGRGAGESAPLEAPNTPEGRDLNRRLQVVITPLS
jgi:outer membrane protein OmpA-like peptidoglycan-associated protein